MQTSQSTKGKYGEYLAALWYKARFYNIISSRMRNYAGEIDLIVKRRNIIVFVEVKYRTQPLSHDYEFCSTSQKKRIINAAKIFLQQHPEYQGLDIRFDLVIIAPRSLPEVFENAWEGEE